MCTNVFNENVQAIRLWAHLLVITVRNVHHSRELNPTLSVDQTYATRDRSWTRMVRAKIVPLIQELRKRLRMANIESVEQIHAMNFRLCWKMVLARNVVITWLPLGTKKDAWRENVNQTKSFWKAAYVPLVKTIQDQSFQTEENASLMIVTIDKYWR